MRFNWKHEDANGRQCCTHVVTSPAVLEGQAVSSWTTYGVRMVTEFAPLLGAAVLQYPAPFDTTLGQLFLAIVAFLAILFVSRIALKIAWKIALVAGIGVGAFLLVSHLLV